MTKSERWERRLKSEPEEWRFTAGYEKAPCIAFGMQHGANKPLNPNEHARA